MIARPSVCLTLLAIMVVSAHFLAACTDDEQCCDDLESYFERVDEIDNETRADFQDLDEDIAAAFPSGAPSLNESTRGAITEAYARGEEILTSAVSDLEEITPPEEVAEAHVEAVEGYIEFRQSWSVLRSRIPSIMNLEDFINALEGQANAGQRASDACDRLQEIADTNSIEVTLDCGAEVPDTP